MLSVLNPEPIHAARTFPSLPFPSSVLQEGSMKTLLHLDRIGQRDGDSQRQPFWYGHYKHSDPNDEELDKVLDVDGDAFHVPPLTLHPKRVDRKGQYQEENCESRHEKTCPGNTTNMRLDSESTPGKSGTLNLEIKNFLL